MTARIESCIGGCGAEGPVVPRHPAVEGYLCDECRARDCEVLDLTAICLAIEGTVMGDDAEDWCDQDYFPVVRAIVANVRRAGYRIVPSDPHTWETVEPSPRIVACPLCSGHVELEDAAGVDEFAGVVS